VFFVARLGAVFASTDAGAVSDPVSGEAFFVVLARVAFAAGLAALLPAVDVLAFFGTALALIGAGSSAPAVVVTALAGLATVSLTLVRSASAAGDIPAFSRISSTTLSLPGSAGASLPLGSTLPFR